jgi:ketosteroid isomerase-like protein
MGEYTRDEIEQAYAHYRAAAAEAGASGDWDPWADLFTEDAVYIEHLYGTFTGREAIRTWISTTMAEPLNREMTAFPAEWWVIDEERAWVVCAVWNRMQDIGDGELHQAINWSLLKYAGDNQWSYEEDIYNVGEFGDMMKGYLSARKETTS